jgi:hypothetical protein
VKQQLREIHAKLREVHAIEKWKPRIYWENALACALLNLQLYEAARLETEKSSDDSS